MRRFAFAGVAAVVLAALVGGVAGAGGAIVPGKTLVERWNGAAWVKIASPSPAGGDQLLDVDAIGLLNAWAVGVHGRGQTSHPLIEHWNGSKWVVQTPPSTPGGTILRGVAAIAADDAWAVGDDGVDGIVLHWDGHHWTRDQEHLWNGARLGGVAANGHGDVWAVGELNDHGFAAHFDGEGWSAVATPNAPGEDRFSGVTAISDHDAWAVGTSNASSPGYRTLAEHWDGQSWKIVATPGGNGSTLSGVADRGSSSVYAAGSVLNSQGCLRTLIERWDGHHWVLQTTPNPFSCDNELLGIGASANGAVAVGDHPQNCPGTACKQVTLTVRLVNGSWHLTSSPSTPALFNLLSGASGVPGSNQFWAVGVGTNGGGG